jgi:hypothetical protein
MNLDELFAERPLNWGLRGDPYLWLDMRAELGATEDPGTAEAFDWTGLAHILDRSGAAAAQRTLSRG